jgi:hypothetical protein
MLNDGESKGAIVNLCSLPSQDRISALSYRQAVKIS